MKISKIEWRHQNLINLAFDLGCTETEIRQAFEGDLEEREFMERQLQAVIKERQAKK